MSQGVALDGGRELEILRQKEPLIGQLLQRVISGVNQLAKNVSAGSMGELDAPPPVDGTEVAGTYDSTTNTTTVDGEVLHFVHTHNAPINRNIKYVTEIDTDPSFPNPHPIKETSSRSGFSHLPANTGDGLSQHEYYLRVTTQYPGSTPSRPTVFGGVQGATKILMTGNSNVDLLTSQSGGTARPGQGGKGLGPTPSRGPVGGPKRDLK